MNWLQELNQFFQMSWDLWGHTIQMSGIIKMTVLIIAALIFILYINPLFFRYFLNKEIINRKTHNKTLRIAHRIVTLFAITSIIWVLRLDLHLFSIPIQKVQVGEHISSDVLNVSISTILLVFIIFQLAHLADWIVRVFLHHYELQGETEDNAKPQTKKIKANRSIRYLFYISALVFILNWLNLDVKIMTVKERNLTVSNLLQAVNTLLMAWVIIWLIIHFVLRSYYKKSKVDVGNQFAINQLVKYVVYIFAILIALQNNLHFDLNILLGGAAALLVGIGLGMQHIFNDLISGIILLFERTVEVGNIVEIDGMVGTVKSIGIRTSSVLILDKTTVVVPNSQFISERVKNWSHNKEDYVRFFIPIGVAYGSDTALVKDILIQTATNHASILQQPPPFVRFTDFADSSLNFELHFWSRSYTKIEDVKSDLRFSIDTAFRENNIEIPFPQVVVWNPNHSNS